MVVADGGITIGAPIVSQLVADAAHRADERRSSDRGELAAKVRHIHVDDIGIAVGGGDVPDMRRELAPRYRMSGVAGEVLEEVGLAARQGDLHARAADDAVPEIE